MLHHDIDVEESIALTSLPHVFFAVLLRRTSTCCRVLKGGMVQGEGVTGKP